jgi:hypothetical protein
LEEREGFSIVRAVIASEIPYTRVFIRDQKTYCAVLIDDNNRKPVCRLHFNRAQKYLGLFDAEKVETRMPIDRVEDIYQHSNALRETARLYVWTERLLRLEVPLGTGSLSSELAPSGFSVHTLDGFEHVPALRVAADLVFEN